MVGEASALPYFKTTPSFLQITLTPFTPNPAHLVRIYLCQLAPAFEEAQACLYNSDSSL